ncbi:MAG TPA: VWA domain-containing protein [Blastocatellia bacterium]|nr:VWA domain-containing protein [Blastocatellia bacterium]
MKSNLFARCFVAILLVAGFVWALNSSSSAQSGKPLPPPPSQNETRVPKDSEREKSSNRSLGDSTPLTFDENGTIKMDTALVTIPVSAMDRDGKFVPYLKKRDFHIYEDGVEQDIESFNSVKTPFHVALVLDTSNSTKFKFDDIQNAAFAFIKQLRSDDQVMVVSFDSKVRFHCDFTSDYDELRRAIDQTRISGSTKLYDAVDKVVDRLEQIQGRKAIVLFTDGVDTASHRANFQNTILKVEESGAIVYPIKYDTENDVQRGGVQGPTTSPWPNPSPSAPGRRRWPFSPFAGQFSLKWKSPQWRFSQWPGRAPSSGGVTSEEYRWGARYLQELADRSGGRLYDANTLNNVSQAFSMIAEELRHQYALSYYPTNSKKDGAYRRLKVRVDKSGITVRAREGYRAVAEMQANTDVGGTDRPELKRKP